MNDKRIGMRADDQFTSLDGVIIDIKNINGKEQFLIRPDFQKRFNKQYPDKWVYVEQCVLVE